MTAIVPVEADATEALAALAEIHAGSFAKSWDAVALARMALGPGVFILAASDRAVWTGFVMARIAGDESEIVTLAVRGERRRQGLGAKLTHAACAGAREAGAAAMFLEVARANTAARALYAALGFVERGVRRGYFGPDPGDDALVLRLDLKSS